MTMKYMILFTLITAMLVGCAKTTDSEPLSAQSDALYNWLIAMQDEETGLLASSESSELVSLYDNALAAIIYTYYGDYNKAERIFDFFSSKLTTEFHNRYGGFAQFRHLDGEITDGIGRRWLGDNGWLLIALNYYHKEKATDRYSAMAYQLEEWIRSLQQEDGSLYSGYDEAGKIIQPVTEAMIDVYNAVPGHDDFHDELYDYLKDNRYSKEDEMLKAWPGHDKYEYALDVLTWGTMVLPELTDGDLKGSANRFQVKTTVRSNEVEGYCFDEDLDAIWIEGTLQMALAYALAPDNYDIEYNRVMSDMTKLIQDSLVYEDTRGLPYATGEGSHYGDTVLWEGAWSNNCVSSCAWYLMADNKINPFENKNSISQKFHNRGIN